MKNLDSYINEASKPTYTLNIEEIGLLDWILTDIAADQVNKEGEKKDVDLFNELKDKISKIYLDYVGE